MSIWVALASVLGSAYQSSQLQKAADKALEIGNANADDIQAAARVNASEVKRLARLNAAAVLSTANLNAESIWKVGLANANAEIDAASENLDLYGTELDEVLYRHKLKSVQLLSEQTAGWGASGVRVGDGSPVVLAQDSVAKLGREQQYLGKIGDKTLAKIGNEGIRRGELTWLSAKERGVVLVSTALKQKEIMLEEANARAAGMRRDAALNASSLRRGGSLIAMNYRNQATTSLINGIMGGITYYHQYG